MAETENNSQHQCADTANCLSVSNIRNINIEIDDIFNLDDPKQNNWLYRLVNKMKIQTEDDVIKRDLLFAEGSEFNESDVLESERILRKRRYLFDTKLETSDNPDGSKDVNIKTRDVWTTLPYFKYQTGGGASDWSFGVHESNLLGKGKRVDVIHQQLEERTGDLIIYQDPNTGWHRTSLYVRYEDNDDGKVHNIQFTRPYFQLSTPNAGSVDLLNLEQENIVYDFGKPMGRYQTQMDDLSVFWGTKLDWDDIDSTHIHRINVGASHYDHNFNRVLGYDLNAIPDDWDANIAWVEYQAVRDHFIKLHNVKQMSEVEDINLGLQFRARLGYTSSSFNRLDKSAYTELEVSKATLYNHSHMFFTSLGYKGFLGNEGVQGSLLDASASYHWNNFNRGQLYVSLNVDHMDNPFQEDLMLLGGKSGMRGFPAYFQTGSKRYLLNVEQRYFGTREWFSLFYLGGAIFYDQGRNWGESLFPQSFDGTLRDIGIGLRFSPTRALKSESGHGYVLHFDVATPLNGPEGISSTQFLLKVKHQF